MVLSYLETLSFSDVQYNEMNPHQIYLASDVLHVLKDDKFQPFCYMTLAIQTRETTNKDANHL